MKEWAEIITKHLSSFVEILAAIVIAIALLQFLYQYIRNLSAKHRNHQSKHPDTLWELSYHSIRASIGGRCISYCHCAYLG